MKGVTIFIIISCVDEIFSVFILFKNQNRMLNSSITYLIAVNCFPSGKWEGVGIWSPSPAMLPTAAHQNSSLKETASFFNKLFPSKEIADVCTPGPEETHSRLAGMMG